MDISHLHVEGLQKTFKKRQVVKNFSLDIYSGQVVGLLGPNGAGKTTSFYMIAGLIAADAGCILLDGQDLVHQPIHYRAQAGIGYLPQEASIFRKMTVEQNIRAILEIRLKDTHQIDSELNQLLHDLNIERLRHSPAPALSGGERRRVEIARVLAMQPRFILLDEPFAGVDPIAVEDIQYIVWKLKDRHIGILITDHNVEETLSITDRAYLLFEGRILFQGTPEELAANQVVRDKYLTNSFKLRKKDFQSIEKQKENSLS